MWIKQAILETRYACYGHFYTIVDKGVSYPCRSVLEIVSNELELDSPDLLSSNAPNATVVMMNPGSSTPIQPQDIRVKLADVSSMDTLLVAAHPDDTQFQIMRIMEFKKWRHVRVLNLSDLRNPQSGSFYESFVSVEQATSCDFHSIFSDARRSELKRKLLPRRPIIAAWGVSPKLTPLVKKCVSAVPGGFMGVRKEGSDDKYYHPLLQGSPMNQKEWLQKICTKLGA